MHKISNNWSLNGSKKEKKENRKDKDKEQGGKIWNKIFELSRGNGRLDREATLKIKIKVIKIEK